MVGLFTGTPGIAMLAAAGLFVFVQPLYIAVVAMVLRACGNSKPAVAKWALRQADRNRMIEIVRAVRGKANDGQVAPRSGGAANAAVDAREPR